ncbi:unnamed protein product [Haemophilus influenzae 10810]|uniref:Uncharacterized protein orf3 n=1 Tax=Haemophilus influenzae TaxID=727 RepID=Q7WRX1_HAEIF|nr:unknown protein [Haemophilus influenzae]CBW29347.1 unnamed protein product [Haemophilus influenzae 10810]AAP42177.1 unknown protein [Haemophilus influenzae]AAP42187.1 unknown protein [Haemophilus influenzae]AAP42198.1 unknown protein [Haemophilus influenzae]
MKFSHLTDTIILFGDEFDNFQTKLIRVGHNLHLKLGVQILGCSSFISLKVISNSRFSATFRPLVTGSVQFYLVRLYMSCIFAVSSCELVNLFLESSLVELMVLPTNLCSLGDSHNLALSA